MKMHSPRSFANLAAATLWLTLSGLAFSQSVSTTEVDIGSTVKPESSVDTYLYLHAKPAVNMRVCSLFSLSVGVNGQDRVDYGKEDLRDSIYSAKGGPAIAGSNSEANPVEYILISGDTELVYRIPLSVKWQKVRELTVRIKMWASPDTRGEFALATDERDAGNQVFAKLSDGDSEADQKGGMAIWELSLDEKEVRDLLGGRLDKDLGEQASN